MQNYARDEFNELLKDEYNQKCFDCDKTPAQWASVNNGLFLCIGCSGNHRGYGVEMSYIRSITLDKWTDTQILFMQCGGNKNCQNLLEVYNIQKIKVDKEILYNSKLMDFYRKYLKAKVNGQKFEVEPPSKEQALQSSSLKINQRNSNLNKFKSISSETILDNEEQEGNFKIMLNEWMNKAKDSTMYIAKKVGELEIGNKLADAGNAIIDKGTEISKSETMTTFAKKANETLNYYINYFLGFGKQTNNEETQKKESEGKEQENNNS